jgi:hypothetical protein
MQPLPYQYNVSVTAIESSRSEITSRGLPPFTSAPPPIRWAWKSVVTRNAASRSSGGLLGVNVSVDRRYIEIEMEQPGL